MATKLLPICSFQDSGLSHEDCAARRYQMVFLWPGAGRNPGRRQSRALSHPGIRGRETNNPSQRLLPAAWNHGSGTGRMARDLFRRELPEYVSQNGKIRYTKREQNMKALPDGVPYFQRDGRAIAECLINRWGHIREEYRCITTELFIFQRDRVCKDRLMCYRSDIVPRTGILAETLFPRLTGRKYTQERVNTTQPFIHTNGSDREAAGYRPHLLLGRPQTIPIQRHPRG